MIGSNKTLIYLYKKYEDLIPNIARPRDRKGQLRIMEHTQLHLHRTSALARDMFREA